MADITMPQLGESVTEGTITQWFKKVGDHVDVDEVIFEVSTDKVDTEVPSPVAGVLTEIRVPEGETVDVGVVLAVVGDAAGAPAASSGDAHVAPAAVPAEPVPSEPVPSEPAPSEPVAPAPISPAPVPPTAVPPAPVPPTPVRVPDPAISQVAEPVGEPAAVGASSDQPVGPPEQASAGSDDASDGVLLSPVVRRLMNESGLTPNEVSGTGLGGRITREDVLSAMDRRTAVAGSLPADSPGSSATTPTVAAAVSEAVLPAEGGQSGADSAPIAQTVPSNGAQSAPQPQVVSPPITAAAGPPTVEATVEAFNKIRRVTGERMVASKAISPHVITAIEVDFERVEEARRAHKERFKAEEGFSLTFLPFISRAVVESLSDFPRMNATVNGEGLELHQEINLAYAVDLNFEGLLAPVLPAAGDKRLRAIARELHALADRARTKRLSPNDLVGGTFTISNSGSYGTFMVAPIINQPQVAILSTDGVSRKPVVISDDRGNESLAVHSVGMLTLSWDHRAFDGAYAAAFMQRLRTVLETRDWMSEL